MEHAGGIKEDFDSSRLQLREVGMTGDVGEALVGVERQDEPDVSARMRFDDERAQDDLVGDEIGRAYQSAANGK